jgi:hypothetical protein
MHCTHCTQRVQRVQRHNNLEFSMDPNTLVPSPDAAGAAPVAAPLSAAQTAADLLGRVVAARDLDRRPLRPTAWLWHGYLGPGKVTLLTSQWKSGKTTLVALLLSRLQQGGTLAGLSVAPARAFIISEECEADWRPRLEQLGFRDHVDFLCRPFTAQPNFDQWQALLEVAATLRDRRGIALLVIDSLAQFLPAHRENSAGGLLECLTPLQRLAAAGLAVLLLHHPRKGKAVAGQAARGSGSLASFVDILVEMSYYSHPDDLDRRRRLVAFSRYDETPRHLLLELRPDGRDYAVLQSGMEALLGEGWQAVAGVLASAFGKLTRQEILEQWPEDVAKPDPATLWRWLNRAAAQGLVRQEGTGRPGDSFRYWLAEREPLLYPQGGTPEEVAAWGHRCAAEAAALLGLPVEAGAAAGASEPPNEDATAAAAGAGEEEVAASPAPGPLPAPRPDIPAEASAVPDRPPPPAAPAAEAPVKLPWPYNIMNPAEVPEEVLRRARAEGGQG